jgi:hypothetical protein
MWCCVRGEWFLLFQKTTAPSLSRSTDCFTFNDKSNIILHNTVRCSPKHKAPLPRWYKTWTTLLSTPQPQNSHSGTSFCQICFAVAPCCCRRYFWHWQRTSKPPFSNLRMQCASYCMWCPKQHGASIYNLQTMLWQPHKPFHPQCNDKQKWKYRYSEIKIFKFSYCEKLLKFHNLYITSTHNSKHSITHFSDHKKSE